MKKNTLFSEQLIQRLKEAHLVVALTGAGVSAESGVPTFRGADGLWKQFRAEELATPQAFVKNPQLVWEWYNYRRNLLKKIDPNPGHYALVELEKALASFHLITQNVDGLHTRAGSGKVVELHGNILRNKCFNCQKIYFEPEYNDSSTLPKCSCGGLLRPNVVWFGEMLDQEILDRAYRLSEECQLFFSIGTSSLVYPAAELPYIAKRNKAYIVEINLEKTEISGWVNERIAGKSGEILPQLVESLKCIRMN